MDTFSFLASVLGVYVAISVFTLGMAWRVYQWVTTPKSPARFALYPKPKTSAGRLRKLMTDTFVAPQSFRMAPGVMIAAMAFHVAALAAFIGHLRLVHEFTPLAALLGEEGMDRFASVAGGTAGVVMLIAVLYWIARRTFGHYKNLSTPEDFLLLFLLLGVIVMGNHLRFVGTVHAQDYMEWFRSLMAFKPAFPEALSGSRTLSALNWHMLFVNAFLIYFPFSKLTHAVGAFATNLVRSSE